MIEKNQIRVDGGGNSYTVIDMRYHNPATNKYVKQWLLLRNSKDKDDWAHNKDRWCDEDSILKLTKAK
jgi:hypothetical protein